MVMLRSISRAFIQTLVFLPVFAGIGLAGQIIYVDGDSPAGDGSSWAAAFKYLQDALATADANDEIRVAQGIFVPDQNSLNPNGSGDRTATFQLISGVALYGGYAGYGERDPDARDVREYETILTGDLRGNDFAEALPAEYATERTRAENSYNVVTSDGTDETAILDGFTITAGQADLGGKYGTGGGMYKGNGSSTLVNCTFTRNWASSYGGAIRGTSGNLVVVRCRFIGNASDSYGGAVGNYSKGSAEFINCSFTGNQSISKSGGAIHCREMLILTNCTFCGNSAASGGGIIVARGDAILTNCIFWGNWDGGGTSQSAQIYDLDAGVDVNFCCIQGWTGDLGGVGNTGADPLLADADGADNLFGTIDDNPRLLPGSASLNAGDNGSVPIGLISDLDGNPRITDGTVDIGAYEGVTQAILLTTESLTIPEGGTDSFGVSLAMAPDASVEVAAAFESGDTDIVVDSETTLIFDSNNYSMPQVVVVSAGEDADYLHGVALVRVESDNFTSVGVTVREQDNEPTTGIVYVDDDATGSGDGMTWTGAYRNLQDALHMALWHPQVWEVRVGQGIYRPDEGARMVPGERDASFNLTDGVIIKGGYAGLGSADPDARNAALYETILSGDLEGDDGGFSNNDENSYHVVYTRDTNESAVLDGFTITAGNADSFGSHRYYGAGIYSLWASPTVANCTFTGNSSAQRGGGMYNAEASLHVKNCIFSNNLSGTDGGGIYNHHGYPEFTNCIVSGNFAAGNGGGIGNDNKELHLTNCTVVDNEAGEFGGGIFDYDDGELHLTNCILWDNIAYEGPQMAVRSRVEVFIDHCCLQGGELDVFVHDCDMYWVSGNTDADPRFADPSTGDYHLKSQAGRWDSNEGLWTRDKVTSACIDTGDPNSDWTAELWPHGKRVNMGAFGGTAEASMSESSLGNRADLDHSGSVNFEDFAWLTNWWHAEGSLRTEDLNRDAMVDFFDISAFVEEWLWQEME